ncbi:MAG: HepT-like ribonuclease domain-containing protein [Candidatus Falkowbacteria bacterium]
MPIDKKLISRKITLINNDLKSLKALSRLSLKTYLSKADYEALAERYLERVIGRMIDINYHVLSEKENEIPTDFYNSFIALGKRKYLPMKLAETMANSAGLRNRLAHEYDEIDARKVYEAMAVCLTDVPKYLKSLVKLLNL